jgi:IS1 family transposase
MDEKMRGLTCKNIEVDEIWGFIGAKRKNAASAGAYGDVWTFIALDADTKLIPSFVVGKRDAYHTALLLKIWLAAWQCAFNFPADAMAAYPDAIERGFGSEVDYGQLVKTYAVTPLGNKARGQFGIVPAEVVKVERRLFPVCRTWSRLRQATLKSRITRCGCTAAV